MAEYKMKTNTSESKQEEKKVDKIITGTAKTKPNEVRKFAGLIVSDDASNVGNYVLMDVLIPTFKKAVVDVVEMILFGEKGGKRRSDGRTPYRSYYDARNDRPRKTANMAGRFDYDDISFDSRGDAELVLDQMRDLVDGDRGFGLVTVADMYDLAGLQAPFTARKYGWFNLRTAEVIRGRDGFYIRLPKAMPID
ncbi:MAG: hypothetical protein ACLS2Y_08830 [Mediterraneibacter faecis]